MRDNSILKIILEDLQKLSEKKKKLSKKQKKIAQAAPPPDEITGADFKALNKKKKLDEGDTNRLVCPNCGTHNPEGIDECINCGHPYPDPKGTVEWDDVASEGKRKRRKAPKKDRKNPKQYDAPQGSSRDKGLDKAAALYAKGDTKGAARVRQAMEKPYIKESKQINELNELLNDMIEEQLLDEMLNDLENHLDEKRKRKKKKKKKKGGGLSAAVKKSLDKKADKRGLTRGSVYTEFRKGLAAFLSSGSRKGMSAHQWAHARVNSANPSKSWASVKKRKGGKKKKK